MNRCEDCGILLDRHGDECGTERRPWMPQGQADAVSAAEGTGLVPLGDERLDEMLAGGLRAGELCVIFGTYDVGVGGVRRHLPDIVCHCARTVGGVFYAALDPGALGAVKETQRRLASVKTAHPVRTAVSGGKDLERIQRLASHYAEREDIHMVVIDSFEAITPARRDVDAWESAAQVARDAKALTRIVGPKGVPVVLACSAWSGSGSRGGSSLGGGDRELPADPLVAAGDVLIRTNGRYTTMVKNRHGSTQLLW